jgi:hypothetical protein
MTTEAVNQSNTMHLSLRLQPMEPGALDDFEVVDDTPDGSPVQILHLPELRERFGEKGVQIDRAVADLSPEVSALRQQCLDQNEKFKLTKSDYILIALVITAFVAATVTGFAAAAAGAFALALLAITAQSLTAGGMVGFLGATDMLGPNRFTHPNHTVNPDLVTDELIDYAKANNIDLTPDTIQFTLDASKQ